MDWCGQQGQLFRARFHVRVRGRAKTGLLGARRACCESLRAETSPVAVSGPWASDEADQGLGASDAAASHPNDQLLVPFVILVFLIMDLVGFRTCKIRPGCVGFWERSHDGLSPTCCQPHPKRQRQLHLCLASLQPNPSSNTAPVLIVTSRTDSDPLNQSLPSSNSSN